MTGTQAAAAPPIDQVVHAIGRAAKIDGDKIEIRLNPEHLGTVEVKLELRHDGSVSAALSADRAETLQLLSADAPKLEQSLRDVGLRTDSGSLSFSLRDSGAERQDGRNARNQGRGAGTRTLRLAELSGIGAAASANASSAAASGALDIRI